MSPATFTAAEDSQVARVESARPLGARMGSESSASSAGGLQSHKPLPTDDEILGLTRSGLPVGNEAVASTASHEGVKQNDDRSDDGSHLKTANAPEPVHLRAVLNANPELREAWHTAKAYQQSFGTPEEARRATELLTDFNRMDALFFSQHPEDHAQLVRAVAALDPASFESFARAVTQYLGGGGTTGNHSESDLVSRRATARQDQSNVDPKDRGEQMDANRTTQPANMELPAAQANFVHAANASAVESVLMAIEAQVDRLLPEGISKGARNRVVGEIYRELDSTLRSNRELARQIRDALRSGSLDSEHQRAVVSLVTSRARQALPGVAKRVLNEWTSTLVAANQERRARQRAAEGRVDIAGSGGGANDGRHTLAPREIDYARMTDTDILNL